MAKSKKITKLLLKGCNCENCKFMKGEFTISPVDKTVGFFKNPDEYCQKRKTKPLANVCVEWKLFEDSIVNLYKLVSAGYPSMIAEELVKVQPIGTMAWRPFPKDEK